MRIDDWTAIDSYRKKTTVNGVGECQIDILDTAGQEEYAAVSGHDFSHNVVPFTCVYIIVYIYGFVASRILFWFFITPQACHVDPRQLLSVRGRFPLCFLYLRTGKFYTYTGFPRTDITCIG
jgi:hypothetical protein